MNLDASHDELSSELATIEPKTGLPPEERLKDADSLRHIHKKLEEADQNGAHNRAEVRKLIDGSPPFSYEERVEEGTEDLFNVNTGTARLVTDESTSGVLEMFNANRNLAEIPLKPTVPDSMRTDLQRKIEHGFTRMMRSWDLFSPRVTNLANTFTGDGVGILFFEDDDTWYFNSCGLAEMKFPRNVEPVSSKIPVATLYRRLQVGELWRKIKDEETAKKKGWNPEAVKKAIFVAANQGKLEEEKWRNWELLQRELKSNELYLSTVCKPVEVVYGFIEEFDGSISVYVASRDESENRPKEFLYKKRGAYKSANELYQIFPYSTGNGNDLYTIRGMGFFIFQLALSENIMFSRFMDAAISDASQYFQSRSGEEIEDAVLEDYGPNALLAPGVQLAENRQSRGLHQNLVPAMKEIREMLNRVSGGLNEGPLALGERANADNIAVSMETLNKMNAFAIQLAYPPLDRVYQEVARRIFLEGKDTPESLKMKKELGLSKEVYEQIDFDNIRAVRILGGGSRAARLSILRQIGMKYGSMDAQGRKEYDWDLIAELGDESRANRYIGNPQKTRQPVDAKIAVLENADMLEGEDLDPFDGEDHLTHLQIHLSELLETKESVEDNPEGLEDYVLRYIKIWEHAQKTLAMLSIDDDSPFEAEAREMKAQLQRLGEFFHNGIEAIRAKGGAEQQGGQQMSPEQQEVISFQNQERRKDEESQAKIARENAAAQAKIARETAIADAKTATEIRNK